MVINVNYYFNIRTDQHYTFSTIDLHHNYLKFGVIRTTKIAPCLLKAKSGE